MTERRRYTKRTKMEAVVTAELSGTRAAADAVGIPESTIRYWMDDPKFAHLRDKTREDLVQGADVLTHRILGRISATLDDFEPRDLTILFGVMVDKAQLLSGGATSRTEARDITGTITDSEVRDAIRTAEHLLAGSAAGAAEATEGTPEG